MTATLHMIREKYGSVERYLREACRLPPEAIVQLRRNLVVDGDPIDWQSHAKAVAKAEEESMSML
jgi:hypothetical protein